MRNLIDDAVDSAQDEQHVVECPREGREKISCRYYQMAWKNLIRNHYRATLTTRTI